MYVYDIFGLSFGSDVEFPQWPKTTRKPEIFLRHELLTAEKIHQGQRTGRRVANHLYHEYLDSSILFEIVDGHTIKYDLRKSIADDVLRGWVVGIFLPVLLRQRGLLVIHACTIKKNGSSAVFVGNSGWGKSTIASFFTQQGWKLLSDDVTAIDVTTVPFPTALPGFPDVRIRPQSRFIIDSFDALPKVHQKTDKRIHRSSAFTSTSAPVRKVYVLDPTADKVSCTPLQPSEAVMHLIVHTRSKDLLSEASFGASNLQQCSRLASSVPMSRLARSQSLSDLSLLHDVVLNDFEAALHNEQSQGAM